MSSSSAAARVFRRLLSTHRSGPRAVASIPPKSELQAIKVDNGGRAWRIGVQVGRGEGLLGDLHPRDAPLLERTGSFGDTPATLTTRPVSVTYSRIAPPANIPRASEEREGVGVVRLLSRMSSNKKMMNKKCKT